MNPAWTTVISALIAAMASLLVCVINNHYARKQTEAKQNETITLINYKLEALTKQVEKHNHLVERVYELEKGENLHAEQIKVANHRIHDLEEKRND